MCSSCWKKEWYLKNKEVIKGRAKNNYHEHRDERLLARRERSKELYRKNILERRIANREKAKRLYWLSREKKILEMREYKEQNKELLRERRLKAYADARVEKRLKLKLYRHNNPDLVKKWKLKSYYKDVDLSRENKRTRDILMRSLGGLTEKMIQQVYERNIRRNNGVLTCYLCHKPVEDGEDNLEHKVPTSRGGRNEINNLDVACRDCNLSKGARTYVEFMLQEGVECCALG